jgi:hypothetical protein
LKIKRLLGLFLVTAEDSLFFQTVPFWGDNFFHIFFHSLRPELGTLFQCGSRQTKDPEIRGLFVLLKKLDYCLGAAAAPGWGVVARGVGAEGVPAAGVAGAGTPDFAL